MDTVWELSIFITTNSGTTLKLSKIFGLRDDAIKEMKEDISNKAYSNIELKGKKDGSISVEISDDRYYLLLRPRLVH